MEFFTIINQIVFLTILAFCGILASRLKILTELSKDVIEKLVFYITLPLLIVTKISNLEITPAILQNSGLVVGFTYLILLIQIIIGNLSAKFLRLPKAQSVIHSMHTYLGNIVFLGFPLLDALFPGGEAILYAALYQLVMNTVLWTYGIYKLNPDQNEKGFRNLKKLVNPNTIALVIGLLMMVFKLRLPEIIYNPLAGLGSTTLYLAMLYIGILLAKIKIVGMFKKRDVLILSLNKLLIIPVILIILIQLILNFLSVKMDETAFSVIILEASMPCMIILVLLAKRFGADDSKAMENFVVSTILSIISLPIVIYLMQLINF
jgi:predicted permease